MREAAATAAFYIVYARLKREEGVEACARGKLPDEYALWYLLNLVVGVSTTVERGGGEED